MSEKRMVYAEDVIQRIRDLAQEILGGLYNPDMENELEQLVCVVESTPTAANTDVQRWRKTAECPPTEAAANDCGMVLAVAAGYIGTRYHKNVETWPFDTVALLPKEFPIWMPLPKLPSECPKKIYWREIACTTICPVCGYECDDDYYLDKFCPGCGTRLWFNEEEAEHDQPDM